MAIIAALLMAAPSYAEWRAVPADESIKVAQDKIEVVPNMEWNRSTASSAKFGETWTADGVALNELTFFAAVEEGDTLYWNRIFGSDKLPVFKSDMLLPEIPELFEKSNRLLLNTPVFTIEKVEADRLSGYPAVRFSYRYAVPDDLLERRGEAVGAIANGKLYLVNFVAPSLHYFEHYLPSVRKLFGSVKLLDTKTETDD